MATPNIKVYTRSWCEDSAEAKKFLQDRAIPFEEIDIERDPEGREFVKRVNEGKERTPTFDANGHTFHCSPFSAEELSSELGLKFSDE